MKYTYTAVFTPIEDGSGFYCKVPDLDGCITTGKDLNDSIDQITDAASIWLIGAEDDDEPIPEPTPQPNLHLDNDAIMSLIRVDTISYRASINTKAVRKNVSIPAWMDNLATKKNINCSQVLQEGLRRILETA